MMKRMFALLLCLAGGLTAFADEAKRVEELPAPPTVTTTRIVTEADATPWDSGQYVYDAAGNISSIGTKDYIYDNYGRLTSGGIPGGVRQAYTYDNAGNLLTTTTYSPATSVRTAGVNAATNRVTTFTESNGPVSTAQYDANGRLLSFPGGQFQYDATDMIVQTTVGTNRAVHLYTASDERIATIAYDALNVEKGSDWTIRDLSGKALRRFKRASAADPWKWDEDYIYRDGQLLAAEVHWPERTRHFHPDHLGSPRLITGNGGAKVSARDFHPFGEEITPADNEPLKFTGHERDSDNLDYMHARYYGVRWGRFLSVDPVMDVKRALHEPQVWNRYSYVVNNPINRVDRDGRADTKSEVASGVFGFLPVAGEFQDASIALTGYDPITAEKQSGWVRAASVATLLVPFVGGKALGEGGEAAARIVGNAIAGARFEKAALASVGVADAAKVRIASFTGTAAYRVPDALTAKSLIEVKGVAKLGLTNQLKDFAAFAKETGREFVLVVRKDTVLTKELEKMAADGAVRVVRQ